MDPVNYSFYNYANSLGAYNSANYLTSSALSNIGPNAALGAFNPCLTGGLTGGFNAGIDSTIAWNKQWNLANQDISLDNINFGVKSQIEQLKAQNTYNINKDQINEPQEKVTYQANRIKGLIDEGKFKQAKEVFDKDFRTAVGEKLSKGNVYLSGASAFLPEGKDGNAKLLAEYKNATNTSLIADIQGKGGQFVTGMEEAAGGIGWWFKENPNIFLSEVQGESETHTDTAKRWAGRVVSGLASAVVLAFGAILAIKGAKEGGIALGRGLRWAVRSI